MKFDFESLSTEPLFYMLMHSGTFVTVLGITFFIIGLLFGYATWGRYKRKTRELLGEAAAMKNEIAGLKRKVGDHSVKSGPAVAIATETIHLPSTEGTTAAAAVPAVTLETITTRDIRPPTTGISTKNRLPKSRANVIKARPFLKPPPPAEPATNDEEVKTPTPPPAEPATATLSLTEAPPPPARHSSPLAAIIAPTAAPAKPDSDSADAASAPTGLVPTDTIPTLTELSLAPLPAVEIQPMADPRLGLIYPTRPEKIDDLTALKGIAQVLEQRLHELGIYTYFQIAHWNEEHIKELSSRLSFKDRIQRERWVEQAQQLLAKKTN
ncbi:MAG: hypothetical protein ACKVY0_25330 [Prosthecobacter sp.]|uniref:hypothetical protein n=1 Tax=Prosthecobacter sp. TaxID=1965333 RepID=UPI0039018C5F